MEAIIYNHLFTKFEVLDDGYNNRFQITRHNFFVCVTNYLVGSSRHVPVQCRYL
jgi:hypothetical protein